MLRQVNFSGTIDTITCTIVKVMNQIVLIKILYGFKEMKIVVLKTVSRNALELLAQRK